MTGKKAQPVVKKPALAAPKPEAPRMAPEAKSRVEALTTPTKDYKEHHGLLRAVSNVLQRGVNDAQEAGMPASKELTGLHARLHQASLHLDAHHNHAAKGNHEQATGHLHIAAEELGRVASALQKHAGPSVKDADGSDFPLSFVNNLTKDVAKSYSQKAGITSPKSAIERSKFKTRDTHTLEALDFDMSGGAEVRQAKVRKSESELASSVLDTNSRGSTHTLERSKYKSAAPRFPARIYGPDKKGA